MFVNPLSAMRRRGNALLRAVSIATLCLPALLAAPQVVAADWTLDQLMTSLAKTSRGRAAFVETKTMSMLDRPVVSSGELSFTAPDQLEKRTVKPSPETMSVKGDTLTLQRGSQSHTLQLGDYPELAGFIASIRGTLAGDRRALEQSFALTLEGPAERWTMTLKPVQEKLGRNVHLIRIAGVRENIASIEIIQTDGDRSVMAITPLAQRRQ
jgi:outer membrane lipoprotein-sorting protein